jgi:hypothetical protein
VPSALLKCLRCASSVPNALDSVTVRHCSGGTSTLLFKAYEQGRAKWQGDTLHGVWFDEDCNRSQCHLIQFGMMTK